LSRKVARYVSLLADFNFVIKHLPGKKNQANPLSRRPDYDDGTTDNTDVTALPDELFARAIETAAVEQQIYAHQKEHMKELQGLERKTPYLSGQKQYLVESRLARSNRRAQHKEDPHSTVS